MTNDDYDDDERYIEYLQFLNNSSLGEPLGTQTRIERYLVRRAELARERRREAAQTAIALVAVALLTALLIVACLDLPALVSVATAVSATVAHIAQAVWAAFTNAVRWVF